MPPKAFICAKCGREVVADEGARLRCACGSEDFVAKPLSAWMKMRFLTVRFGRALRAVRGELRGAISKALGRLEGRVEDLEGRLSKQERSVASLKGRLTRAERRLRELEKLKEKVGELALGQQVAMSDIDALRAELERTKRRVEELEKEVRRAKEVVVA